MQNATSNPLLRHKWSVLSGATTTVHCAVIYDVVAYLYQRGNWHPNAVPTKPVVVGLGWSHVAAIIVAAATAITGLFVERPKVYALVALVLGLFSYLIYVG